MGVDIIIMRQQNFRIILSEEMIYWLNNITVDPSHKSVAILDRIMTYLSSSRFGSCRFRDQSCGVQVQFYFYCFFYFVLFCSKSRIRSFYSLRPVNLTSSASPFDKSRSLSSPFFELFNSNRMRALPL